jgi:hypothetical protein
LVNRENLGLVGGESEKFRKNVQLFSSFFNRAGLISYSYSDESPLIRVKKAHAHGSCE